MAIGGVDEARAQPRQAVFPARLVDVSEQVHPRRERADPREQVVAADVGAEEHPIAEPTRRAGVDCRVSDNIEGELWQKLIMNCAGNAVTALGRSSYAAAARHEQAREVILATAEEAIAVARAAGVKLPTAELGEAGLKLAQSLGAATSSTAQDIQRGKRTEIDSLNGYIARRGDALGVPTPVNHTLYALVKLLEENSESNAKS